MKEGNSTYSKMIVLFDGECNLCHNTVRFIISHDDKVKFRFGSLQSDIAKTLLSQLNFSLKNNNNTMLLIENHKVYQKSSAVLRIVKQFSGLWPLLSIFLFLPPFLRNKCYDFVGRRRYHWFGCSNDCELLAQQYEKRFLTKNDLENI